MSHISLCGCKNKIYEYRRLVELSILHVWSGSRDPARAGYNRE